MMKSRPVLWVAGLAVLLGGCASQANMVDLETRVLAIQERLDRASALGSTQPGAAAGGASPYGDADFSPVEGASPAAAAEGGEALVPGPGMLDMTLALDQVRQEVAELRGQVEELGFGMNSLAQTADSRLETLESRLGVSTGPLGPMTPGPSGMIPGKPGEAPPGAGPVISTPSGGGITLPGILRDAGTPEQAFALARRDYDRGHFNIAAAGFANFMQQYPDSDQLPEATYWLGASYRAQGQTDRARQIWDTLIKRFARNPASAKALLGLGEMLRAEDDIPGAEDALKRLIAQFPSSDEARSAKRILIELR